MAEAHLEIPSPALTSAVSSSNAEGQRFSVLALALINGCSFSTVGPGVKEFSMEFLMHFNSFGWCAKGIDQEVFQVPSVDTAMFQQPPDIIYLIFLFSSLIFSFF